MTKEYTERWEEYNGIRYLQECDSCGSPAPLVDTDKPTTGPTVNVTDDDKEHLCMFCYETLMGNVFRYPKLYSPETKVVVQGICQALHLVLRELKKPV